MPSVDLRPLLPPPDFNQRPTDSPVDGKRSDLKQPSTSVSRFRFTGPQLANLAFVIAACVGAMFSAAYLFKGDELLHEVAAWPRELFSGRPAVINQTSAGTDNFEPAVIANPLPDQSAVVADNSGDPFSSSRKLLGLDPASKLQPRPNEVMSFPYSAAGPPSNTVTADGHALPSSVPNGGSVASPQSSVANNPATTAAQTAAGSNARAATKAATSATSRAVRSVSRVTGNVRTATGGRAARSANLRSAQPSAFKRTMATIARSLHGPNDGKRKAAQTGSVHSRSSVRTARANRAGSANLKSNVAHRRSSVTTRTSRIGKAAAAKSSSRAAASRKESSRFGSRSAITSRPTGTVGAGLSRTGASSIRSSGAPGFSSSAGGFRSLGSLGGARGLGGGGGRVGFGGGGGFGRGR